MKAITLFQPWATLVAIREKRNETRSWPTKYRGRLAIHSSKKFPSYAKTLIYSNPTFRRVLVHAGLAGLDFPLGCVLATCDLKDCLPTEEVFRQISEQEKEFGDYRPGRFVFFLENIEALGKPIYARGAMGLWEWDGYV